MSEAATADASAVADESEPVGGRTGARGLLTLLPGIALLLAVGLAGKWAQGELKALGAAAHTPLPDIEYVLWAILFGVLIVNTVGLHRVFRPGVATYEFWLKIGIVLLGVRFLLLNLVKLGGLAFVQIILDMVIAGAVILLAARALGLSGKLGSLLAIGTSICGVSAIIAAKGAIRAKNSEVGYAIAAILTLGAVGLFALPALGHAIGLSDHEFGLWAGLAVDNTAETAATGYLYSPEAGKTAVLVKSVRNGLIGFVVLGFATYWAARGEGDAPDGALARARFLWQKFPKFVLGFVAVAAVATAGLLSKGQIANVDNLSKWAFLLTFAGVGLSTDFRQLAKSGWRPFLVAVIGLVVVAVISLGLVLLASRTLGWYR